MPRKKRAHHRAAVTRQEAAESLRSLARAIRRGEFAVPQPKRRVRFHPRGDLQLAVTLESATHSGSLDVELRWTYVPPEEDVTR